MRIIPTLLAVVSAWGASPAAGETLLQPAQASRDVHVLFIFLDGVPLKYFDELLAQGRLPQVQAHLVERGCRARKGLSVFPTVTFPAQAGGVTGLFPGHSSIPGLKWLDRDRLRVRHYLVGDFWKFEDDLLLYSPNLLDFGQLLSKPESMFSRMRGARTASVHQIMGREAETSKFFLLEFGLTKLMAHMPHHTDEAIAAHLEELFGPGGAQPHFTFCCFPDFDSQSHLSGLDSAETRQTLEDFDRQLGGIVEAMKRGGIIEKTYIVLASDHGNTPVGVENVVHYPNALASLGLRPRQRNEREFDCFVAWNALNSVAIYVADPAQGWRGRPGYNALRDFPLPRGGRRTDLLQFLADQKGTDFLMAADGPGRVRVVNAASELLIQRRIFMGESFFSARLSRGERDPWSYLHDPELARMMRSGEFFSSQEWLNASLETSYPDGIVQSVQIFDSFRCGDILVSLQPGWKIKPSRYLTTHGSMLATDMEVPLLISGPGIRQGEIACARLTDIYPTLLRIFGLDVPFGLMDGRPLDEILPAEWARQKDPNEERRTALLPTIKQLWKLDTTLDPADLNLPHHLDALVQKISSRQRRNLSQVLLGKKERISSWLRQMREERSQSVARRKLEELLEANEAEVDRMIVWLDHTEGKPAIEVPSSKPQEQ